MTDSTPTVTKEEVVEAVTKCIEFLEPRLKRYDKGYSVRGILVRLGYRPEQIEAVIAYCAKCGFVNCLDPSVEHNGYFPSRLVCDWMPDQLHSRLRCCNW